MKRILVGEHRETLLSTLETIFRHWGYRVLATNRADRLLALLEQTTTDLLVVGGSLAAEADEPLRRLLDAGSFPGPVFLLGEQEEPALPCPVERLALPLDLFDLFALVQRHLEKIPRQNLRLTIRLPGMVYHGETCRLAEVLSLSTQGLFIRTGLRIGPEDRPRILFPLMGMKKEVELEGKVLYQVEPGPENNYLQGVGLQFVDLDPETSRHLEAFVAARFFGDLTATHWGRQGLSRHELAADRPAAPSSPAAAADHPS